MADFDHSSTDTETACKVKAVRQQNGIVMNRGSQWRFLKFLVGDEPEDQGAQRDSSLNVGYGGFSQEKFSNCFMQIVVFLAVLLIKVMAPKCRILG